MPGFSPRLAFGCQPCAAGQKIIARNFAAPYLRLSLRRSRTEIHCPKLQRGTTSVHGFDAADARALPGSSSRLAFGCQPCAAGLKLVARNFNAAFLRCMDLTRQTPGHCPLFHRACFRLSAMRSRTEIHCPKFLRGRHRLNIIQPCGRKFIFLLFLFRFAFNNQ